MLLRLLKGQAKIVKTIPVENRLEASYLGKVLLSGNKHPLDVKLLQEIKTVRLSPLL